MRLRRTTLLAMTNGVRMSVWMGVSHTVRTSNPLDTDALTLRNLSLRA